jgi:hypothetical protein
MHIWTIEKWRKYYNKENIPRRCGLRLRFDQTVDPEVKRSCKEFCQWLRKEYFFPQRIVIYFKSSYQIKAFDGEMVSGTCFLPFDKNVEPYVRIAVGDYYEMLEKRGKDNALASILNTIAHELTHYFQWINNIQLTEIGVERQAIRYAGYILDEYANTRDYP